MSADKDSWLKIMIHLNLLGIKIKKFNTIIGFKKLYDKNNYPESISEMIIHNTLCLINHIDIKIKDNKVSIEDIENMINFLDGQINCVHKMNSNIKFKENGEV